MAKSHSSAPEVPDNRRGRTLVSLRGMVLRGEIPMLARIEEVELARTLGVSQPLIRRALEQLEQEGLVESTDGNYRVRQLTLSDIRDAIAARGALEGVAVSLAATRLGDAGELERAHKIHSEIEQLTRLFSGDQPPDPEQMARYGSLNADFHNALVDLAKSPLLRWFIDRVYAVAFASPTAVVAPPDGGGAATANAQHAAILQAIAARDGSRAESIVREHALLAFQSLENAVDRRAQADGNVGLALVQGAIAKKKTAAPLPRAPLPRVAKPHSSRPTDLPEGAGERVLDAAASLFSAQGYHATTTRELAALLEMQQASLYHHMASKEDLLYRICRAVMESFLRDLPAALAGAARPLRLGVFIRSHLGTMLTRYERTISMVTEFRALSRPHRTEIAAMESSYSEILRGEIEAAQRSRMLRGDIPEKYLRSALFNYLNWTPRWFHKTGPLKLEELAGIYEAVFFDGVATGVRAGRPAFRPETGTGNMASVKARKPNRETLPRLIAGAAELFSKHGYEATSTRSVATSLGLDKASLYYHVRSKEDLLYVICKSSIERLETEVEAALAGVTDPVDRLNTLIVTQCSSLLRHQTEHATALAEVRALSPERLAQIVSLRKRHQTRVRQTIEAGQKAGAFRDDTPARFLGLMLEGLMDRTVVWYRRGEGCKPAELGRYFAEIFLYGARFTAGR